MPVVPYVVPFGAIVLAIELGFHSLLLFFIDSNHLTLFELPKCPIL
jgi:hypothetical protein